MKVYEGAMLEVRVFTTSRQRKLIGMFVAAASLIFVYPPDAFAERASLVMAGDANLTAELTGSGTFSDRGDADGTGHFMAEMDLDRGIICYELTVSNIKASRTAHIQEGRSVRAKPVITLAVPEHGKVSACSAVLRSVAKDIIEKPDAYSISVTNEDFPRGAVRGKLHSAGRRRVVDFSAGT